MINGSGDEIEVQIAIFDENMRHDTGELAGGDIVSIDITSIPHAPAGSLPPPPPGGSPFHTGSSQFTQPSPTRSESLTGAPKLALELSSSISSMGASAQPLETLLEVSK